MDLGENNFENCYFKDGPTECINKVSCCSPQTIDDECYLCLHPELLITGINKDICKECIYFKNKEKNKEKNNER